MGNSNLKETILGDHKMEWNKEAADDAVFTVGWDYWLGFEVELK